MRASVVQYVGRRNTACDWCLTNADREGLFDELLERAGGEVAVHAPADYALKLRRATRALLKALRLLWCGRVPEAERSAFLCNTTLNSAVGWVQGAGRARGRARGATRGQWE